MVFVLGFDGVVVSTLAIIEEFGGSIAGPVSYFSCNMLLETPILLNLESTSAGFDTYLFKVHSDIVLPSTPRSPQRSLSCRFTC